MTADTHAAPNINPKGLLCNAAAGASAGILNSPFPIAISFFLFPFSFFHPAQLDSFNFFVQFDAGVIAATFVCPLDVIKTRFHVHGVL